MLRISSIMKTSILTEPLQSFIMLISKVQLKTFKSVAESKHGISEETILLIELKIILQENIVMLDFVLLANQRISIIFFYASLA